MINITIIAVGGLKESYFTNACSEYAKRLQSFCKLSIVEISEFKLPQNPSDAEIEKCLLAEGKAIIAKLPPKAYIIPLCIEGKLQSSTELAGRLEAVARENSHVVFIIGSSHGLDSAVKSLADFSLSISPMTFPHQLLRVMLLEQIYRAFSINNGLKYHK